MIQALYDPALMALWAGLATGALISEVVSILLRRRALKWAGLSKKEIDEVVDEN